MKTGVARKSSKVPPHNASSISMQSPDTVQTERRRDEEVAHEINIEDHIYDADSDLADDLDIESHAIRLLPENGSAYPKRNRHKSNHFSEYIPRRLRWLAGPPKPHTYTIRPFFGKAEDIILNFSDRFAPTPLKKIIIFAIASVFWVVAFGSLAAVNNSSPVVPEYGSARRLTCTSSPWPNNRKDCGLNGTDCLPFDHASYPFRCPSGCGGALVWDPYTVGGQVIQYKPLVIGGPNDRIRQSYYRGDSFICSAAIHAGIISDSKGGCGILSLVGERDTYFSTESNGIRSISFNSSFPMSFSLSTAPGESPKCPDIRWTVLAMSLAFTIMVSLFISSPMVFYISTFVVTFFHVAIISDVPELEGALTIVQYAVSRFLPAAFVAFTIYIYCAKTTLGGVPRIERTVLWLGGCWIGALENYTLDKLPIRRLTPQDITNQPGAFIILILLIALIVTVALGQAWGLWVEGRLPQYLILYSVKAILLIVLMLIPGLNLRIHHYILGLLLLPGTALQTRRSLFFQGLLLGLFINGVARWGFASLLETDLWLADRGPIGSPLPDVTLPVITGATISVSWESQLARNWDGVSVRVNDVERFRWFQGDGPASFSLTREKEEDLFFRLGLFRAGFVDGFLQGDYTNPSIWYKNGTWMEGN